MTSFKSADADLIRMEKDACKSAENWPDDILIWFAEKSGKPLPTPGQCNALRQQLVDKIVQLASAGKSASIACDGQKLIVYS